VEDVVKNLVAALASSIRVKDVSLNPLLISDFTYVVSRFVSLVFFKKCVSYFEISYVR
jgi:hypothetical protein